MQFKHAATKFSRGALRIIPRDRDKATLILVIHTFFQVFLPLVFFCLPKGEIGRQVILAILIAVFISQIIFQGCLISQIEKLLNRGRTVSVSNTLSRWLGMDPSMEIWLTLMGSVLVITLLWWNL